MNPFKHFIHTLLKLSTVLDHYAKYNWVLNPSAFCTINEPKIRIVHAIQSFCGLYPEIDPCSVAKIPLL